MNGAGFTACYSTKICFLLRVHTMASFYEPDAHQYPQPGHTSWPYSNPSMPNSTAHTNPPANANRANPFTCGCGNTCFRCWKKMCEAEELQPRISPHIFKFETERELDDFVNWRDPSSSTGQAASNQKKKQYRKRGKRPRRHPEPMEQIEQPAESPAPPNNSNMPPPEVEEYDRVPWSNYISQRLYHKFIKDRSLLNPDELAQLDAQRRQHKADEFAEKPAWQPDFSPEEQRFWADTTLPRRTIYQLYRLRFNIERTPQEALDSVN